MLCIILYHFILSLHYVNRTSITGAYRDIQAQLPLLTFLLFSKKLFLSGFILSGLTGRKNQDHSRPVPQKAPCSSGAVYEHSSLVPFLYHLRQKSSWGNIHLNNLIQLLLKKNNHHSFTYSTIVRKKETSTQRLQDLDILLLGTFQ